MAHAGYYSELSTFDNVNAALLQAELYRDQAGASADAAAASATDAANSAATSTGTAAAALASANNAANSATAASNSATAAAGSSNTAGAQATIALNQANNAATSATTAGNAAIAAANSATAASGSATAASGSATTATTQAGIATTQAGNASTSASNASTSANTAGAQATIALNQANNAAASATAAGTSATNAATSATNAATSETNAGLSATSAQNSASIAASAAATSTAGFKNFIINGNFAINQRGYVSGTATVAANQYTLDRWRVVVSGQSVTFAAGDPTRQITAPAGGIEQVIEGVNIQQTATYIISWVGTATCTVNGTARANGATFSLTSNTNVTVRFSGGTVRQAQLEIGPTVTPFERRPITFELQLCQRYFYQLSNGGVLNYAAAGATTSVSFAMRHPVVMRTAPTITHNVADALYVTTSNPSGSNWSVQVAGVATVTKSGTTTLSTLSTNADQVTCYFSGQTFSVVPSLVQFGPTIFFQFNAEL